MADSLSAATLAIYIILAIPVLYLLVKHGRHGLLGWLFLFLFCGIRIVGSSLALKGGPAASIISNVGLSPLLLSTAGILHEARTYRVRNLDRKLEHVLQLFFHMLVVGGVALTAAGSTKLQSGTQPIDKAEKMVKVGIAILTISWFVLVGWTGVSHVTPRTTNDAAQRAGTMLLASVTFCLVFIGIRVFYSLIVLCTMKAYLSPITGSLAIRVVLGFLPELVSTLGYVAAGCKTQVSAKEVAAATSEADLSKVSWRSNAYEWWVI